MPTPSPIGVIPRAIFIEGRAQELLRAIREWKPLLEKAIADHDKPNEIRIRKLIRLWTEEYKDRLLEIDAHPFKVVLVSEGK
jgi:hypothetical protein